MPQVYRQIVIAQQALKGNFDSAVAFAREIAQIGSITAPLVASTQGIAARSVEQGGFSAVFSAMMSQSMLGNIADNTKKTAENTERDNRDPGTDENRRSAWDVDQINRDFKRSQQILGLIF